MAFSFFFSLYFFLPSFCFIFFSKGLTLMMYYNFHNLGQLKYHSFSKVLLIQWVTFSQALTCQDIENDREKCRAINFS